MIVGIMMQQPTGVAPLSHAAPRDGNEPRGYDSQKALVHSSDAYKHESAQSHQAHTLENGEMQQQEMYVNSSMPAEAGAMSGIENQFQSLGFKQEDSIGTDQLSSSAPNSESNNPEELENEGEEYDDDPPMKLFVGQVSDACYVEEMIQHTMCFVHQSELFDYYFAWLLTNKCLSYHIGSEEHERRRNFPNV